MRRRGLASVAAVVLALGCAGSASAANLGTAGGFTYVKASKQAAQRQDSLSVTKVSAKCPKGKTPVGGGAAIDGSVQNSAIAGSYPQVGGKWGAEVWTYDSPKKLKATAWAICAKKSKVQNKSSFFQSGSIGPSFGSATCTNGATSTGGGFSVSNAVNYFGHATYPFDNGGDGSVDGWTATVYHRFSEPDTSTAYGVCMKGGSPTYPSGQVAGINGVTAKSECSGGQSATGGGYFVTSPDSDQNSYASVSKPIDGDDRGKVPDDGWSVTMTDPTSSSLTAAAIAACR